MMNQVSLGWATTRGTEGSICTGGAEILVGSGLGSRLMYSSSATSAALRVLGPLLALGFCCAESAGFRVLGSGRVGRAVAAREGGGTGVSESLSSLSEGLGALRLGRVGVAEGRREGIGGTGAFGLGRGGEDGGSLPKETASLPVGLAGRAGMVGSRGALVAGSGAVVVGAGPAAGTLAAELLPLGSSV